MEGYYVKLNATGRKILVSTDNKNWAKADYSMLVNIVIFMANKLEVQQHVVSQN